MSWSALPVELIVRILEALDPQTLVKCRRVMFFIARFFTHDDNEI
jgi:hypothetical protein